RAGAMPARRIIRSATHFQLTRVTRIFQKSVFPKAAPSSPGEMPLPGFFCCAPRAPPHACPRATFACGSRPRVQLPLLSGWSLQRVLQLERVARCRPCAGASCFLPARSDELVATTKRPSRVSERQSHDQGLGAKHLGERAEGDVGGGRARAAARAHRRRRFV